MINLLPARTEGYGRARRAHAEWSRADLVLAPGATSAPAAVPSEPTAVARFPLAGLGDRQHPTADLFPVKRPHRCDGIHLAPHLHKAEAAGPPGRPIGDDPHRDDLASALGEQGAELRLVDVKRQVPHVQPRSHDSLTSLAGYPASRTLGGKRRVTLWS